MSSPWSGGLIKQYGTYKTEDGSVSIFVEKEPKTLLKYLVKGREGKVLINSDNAPQSISVIHRWRLYWDNTTEILWVCSGDIGDNIWVKADGGGYEIRSVFDVPEIAKNIPDALLVELSSRRQNWYRNLTGQEDSP
ncbi:MAG: hypothetical protein ACW963_10085 [Candidatus Sifarchaeia archaeon]